jgi:hypothetical protein
VLFSTFELAPNKSSYQSKHIKVFKLFLDKALHPDFEAERQCIETSKQLVLTNFGSAELKEFYDIERLAYELWRTSAQLRALGKGALLVVDDSERRVYEMRSPELVKLIKSYDKRTDENSISPVSASGVVYKDAFKEPTAGTVFLPRYNVAGLSTKDLTDLFRIFQIEFAQRAEPNFVWIPSDLGSFRQAHTPFAQAFKDKYAVELDTVWAVIASLCYRVFYTWMETEGQALWRYWQRAYEGPYTREYVFSEVQAFLPSAISILELDESNIGTMDIADAIRFLELDESSRSMIDLATPGPHNIFMPYNDDRVFIDYAWISRRLYNLFWGIWIPDQNFKGDALERTVRFQKSVLPTGPCKSAGAQKQIDAAFAVGRRLIIVECKAVGWSIGFDRGDPESIQYRHQMVENALDQVDEKARWLANHPLGTNYDIRQFHDILPVVVTPFVEFIPGMQPRYWLTNTVPRVLTPQELEKALKGGGLSMWMY